MSVNALIEERLDRLERELVDLKDREAIRDVIHRYCRGADKCDLELFKSCYWPDAVDDHGFFSGNALEFCDFVIPLLKEIEASFHAISNTIIDLEGDRAFCESQWSVVHRLREGDGFLDFWHQGRYLDIFEKRDGQWKILVRAVVRDMDRLLRAKDLDAIFDQFGAEEGSLGLTGKRAPEDPVYVQFNLRQLIGEREANPDFWGGFREVAKLM